MTHFNTDLNLEKWPLNEYLYNLYRVSFLSLWPWLGLVFVPRNCFRTVPNIVTHERTKFMFRISDWPPSSNGYRKYNFLFSIYLYGYYISFLSAFFFRLIFSCWRRAITKISNLIPHRVILNTSPVKCCVNLRAFQKNVIFQKPA